MYSLILSYYLVFWEPSILVYKCWSLCHTAMIFCPGITLVLLHVLKLSHDLGHGSRACNLSSENAARQLDSVLRPAIFGHWFYIKLNNLNFLSASKFNAVCLTDIQIQLIRNDETLIGVQLTCFHIRHIGRGHLVWIVQPQLQVRY